MGFDGQKFKEYVVEAIEESFENMLFMDAILIDENYDGEHKDCQISNPVEVRILINHPFAGEITLSASQELVFNMAETLFMVSEEEATEKIKLDVMNELLNTISGRIMAKITPENTSFKLGLPEKTETFYEDEEDDGMSIELEDNSFSFIIDDDYVVKLDFFSNK